ncbi:S-layer homology domain-containing protein [Bacillus sp. FJAT-45350]|uniref:S-layer homology domain-containing protein n=1 Tax=Bacillus sp. FJAT-45350 TaxID=2011014 RepID=UPI000BB7156E|nr:S-layer homology domain-containing protein [Bacillus sp. FJAT-45350]
MVIYSKFLLSIVLVISLVAINPFASFSATFPPVPHENSDLGRNTNAYLAATNGPSLSQQEAFVKEVSKHAVKASETWGVPASAIIGMAIIESGYGTTRIAHHANNIFGIKVWGFNPSNAWQLVGQPDEDFDRAIPVIADNGDNRKVFDETQRRDNWYRMFNSYEHAINFLAGTLLQNNRYGFARDQYQQNLSNGVSIEESSKQYLFDIANAGYNHLGGDYYRENVGRLMDRWNLYQYDVQSYLHFRDIRGHWAEDSINLLADSGIISGFPDNTFRPNNSLTRSQSAIIMVNFLELQPIANTHVSFLDVGQNHSAIQPITIVAQHRIMNGTGNNHFSPNTTVTRAQIAQILYNTGQYNESLVAASSSFRDVRNDHWAYTAIQTMRNEGIVKGYEDGSFKPNDPITRGQLATIISNILTNQK